MTYRSKILLGAFVIIVALGVSAFAGQRCGWQGSAWVCQDEYTGSETSRCSRAGGSAWDCR